MLRHWSSWTCPLQSTLSTTPFCVGVCSHAACLVQRYDCSSGICILGRSIRPTWSDKVCSHASSLWSTARIGAWTYSVHYLHGRSGCYRCRHLYADDTQVYGFCRPSAAHDFQQHLSACLDDVAIWMRTNGLQLNTNKTDLLWCSTVRRQHQLAAVNHSSQGEASPSPWVRYLGILIDGDLSMRIHVQRTVASCFATLR